VTDVTVWQRRDSSRLRGSKIPHVPKIAACMIKHRSDLSTGCRMVMDKDLARKPSTVAAQ
jgi:hypothetical protein